MAENKRPKGICSISVQGFKCLAGESRIEIRPLTILAGANSSGKSSIMQPLLLMKQTLQSSFDPGPLLLNGPNVRLTSVDQLVPRPRSATDDHFVMFSVEAPKDETHSITFSAFKDKEIEIRETYIKSGTRSIRLDPSLTGTELKTATVNFMSGHGVVVPWSELPFDSFRTYRDRCFLAVATEPADEHESHHIAAKFSSFPTDYLNHMIHVPGLRGNPERTYDRTASGPSFPGTFEKYVATFIAEWTKDRDGRLKRLETMLAQLGLTSEVSARRVNDAQLELQVGRLPGATSHGEDLVNVADVGFGVSQVLPVLVALLVADEGQLVYVEQPELHLHPRAQYGLAKIMAQAAKRGVRLVAETHSALLLLHLRTLLAKGEIAPDLVRLHWFLRDPGDGTTSIHTADVDETASSETGRRTLAMSI